jgi:2-methylisocitrate lyase-like PEP mutase family enzyme
MPSARPSTADKRKTFRELHRSGCFVIPNPWNVGSALYLQGLGFKAIASTSSGHAHSEGYPDGAQSRDDVLAHYKELAAATDIPLNADFENGFADDPDNVAERSTRPAVTSCSRRARRVSSAAGPTSTKPSGG